MQEAQRWRSSRIGEHDSFLPALDRTARRAYPQVMTITLTPDVEARLREKAAREGSDVNRVAEALIVAGLEWEAQDRAETIEAVRQGEQAASEGRERPLREFLADQRLKHGFATTWPHERDDAA